jgi:peroxiredoxin Q/BCP
MKIKIFSTLLLAAGIVFSAATTFAAMPKAGDTAPLITGQDQDGKPFNLADHVGKKIVLLYFYPKDFTGGCTKEACSFRDGFEDFATNNVEIVGVSFDSADSHLQFITKYKLPFTLLADTDGKIAAAYDVKMPVLNMAKRVSFLIGLDGKIVHVTNTGNPDVHLAEMKAAIAGLQTKQ